MRDDFVGTNWLLLTTWPHSAPDSPDEISGAVIEMMDRRDGIHRASEEDERLRYEFRCRHRKTGEELVELRRGIPRSRMTEVFLIAYVAAFLDQEAPS